LYVGRSVPIPPTGTSYELSRDTICPNRLRFAPRSVRSSLHTAAPSEALAGSVIMKPELTRSVQALPSSVAGSLSHEAGRIFGTITANAPSNGAVVSTPSTTCSGSGPLVQAAASVSKHAPTTIRGRESLDIKDKIAPTVEGTAAELSRHPSLTGTPGGGHHAGRGASARCRGC